MDLPSVGSLALEKTQTLNLIDETVQTTTTLRTTNVNVSKTKTENSKQKNLFKI